MPIIKSGEHERDRGLVVGFMAELSTQLSRTRANLAIYAAVAAKPDQVDVKLKETLVKNAATILKQLGDVI